MSRCKLIIFIFRRVSILRTHAPRILVGLYENSERNPDVFVIRMCAGEGWGVYFGFSDPFAYKIGESLPSKMRTIMKTRKATTKAIIKAPHLRGAAVKKRDAAQRGGSRLQGAMDYVDPPLSQHATVCRRTEEN